MEIGVGVGKKRGASETWGRVVPDGRKETETFAKRTLKKLPVVWDYAKEEVMIMRYCAPLFEIVSSPQETVYSLKSRALGKGPVPFIFEYGIHTRGSVTAFQRD